MARGIVTKGDPAIRFASELAIWDLAGFFYGKHLYRLEPDLHRQGAGTARDKAEGAIQEASSRTGII